MYSRSVLYKQFGLTSFRTAHDMAGEIICEALSSTLRAPAWRTWSTPAASRVPTQLRRKPSVTVPGPWNSTDTNMHAHSKISAKISAGLLSGR
ncbi:hypothetical protein IG631_02435 [Alternaria alternata]|nr:hypothetical protein IG631_02435 [Alternaria alternata]